MSNVSVSQHYSANPENLWALVGAPNQISAWHPAIAASETEGSTRRCTLADGAAIVEEITTHSDADKSYSYRILESPLPIRDYLSTLKVEADGSGAKLTWECQFETVGAPADEVETMIRGLYQAGLEALEAQLK